MQRALVERRELIEARADAVLSAAIADSAPWIAVLAAEPDDQRGSNLWRRAARVIAAYRDKYGVTAATPLAPTLAATTQKVDRARAEAALRVMAQLSRRRDAERSQAHAPTGRGVRL